MEQQGVEGFLEALNVDLDLVFEKVVKRTGLDLSFPAMAGIHGARLAGQFVTVDSLTHSYAVHRLRQLMAATPHSPDPVIAEIGGGYGCLALLAFRAGLQRFAIYDLPWVNALQGYFLIRSLPAGAVCLYGESEGSLQVLPFWRFHQLEPRSIDFVVNTNSLPELPPNTAREYLYSPAACCEVCSSRSTRKLGPRPR